MRRRPIIGITGPDRGGYPAWFFTSWAIRFAGGAPVRITPSRQLPDHLDGLILGGGADISPERYRGGAALRPTMSEANRTLSWWDYLIAPLIFHVRWLLGAPPAGAHLDVARDEMEVGLLARAHREGIPVLGICRGAQLLNIFSGGSLHRDLSTFYVERPNPWTVFPRKQATVEAGSQLATLLGAVRCRVNSLHRQGIDQVGANLVVVARDDSEVVQAVEDPSRPLWLGVQWHPEYLPQSSAQRRLFREVVRAARAGPAPQSVSVSVA